MVFLAGSFKGINRLIGNEKLTFSKLRFSKFKKIGLLVSFWRALIHADVIEF